jgi:RNA polymerase sigma-70 factor (ECF subfamily)
MSDILPRSNGGGVFATTHWSVVIQAGDGVSPAAAAAMEQLCRAYWYPLYVHVRRRGYGPEEARDLTQEFFASLIRSESIARARRERGRFRTFLLGALKRFLSDQAERKRAAKRGGGVAPIELDSLAAEERLAMEPTTDDSPDRDFDRRWAAVLIERSLATLRAEQERSGRTEQFNRLKPFLEHPAEPGDYDTTAEELGVTPNAVAAAVRRLRLRLREIVLAEITQTVGLAGEAESELRALFG